MIDKNFVRKRNDYFINLSEQRKAKFALCVLIVIICFGNTDNKKCADFR
jgi:hypothetical protein